MRQPYFYLLIANLFKFDIPSSLKLLHMINFNTEFPLTPSTSLGTKEAKAGITLTPYFSAESKRKIKKGL